MSLWFCPNCNQLRGPWDIPGICDVCGQPLHWASIGVDPDIDKYLDQDGYPTEFALQCIRTWTGSPRDLMAFVRSLWWAGEWGWRQMYDTDGDMVYTFSTGGWSGNEDLVRALKDTPIYGIDGFFWRHNLIQYRRGGHYVLRLADDYPLGIPCESEQIPSKIR